MYAVQSEIGKKRLFGSGTGALNRSNLPDHIKKITSVSEFEHRKKLFLAVFRTITV